MKALTCQEIRNKWIEFFTQRCGLPHLHIPSASLVPDNPTLLLNSAGMVQFVPIFMGTKPPPNPPRAITIQKCARVGGKDSDLENIGRTTRHHSFFEMLGNFSFGDYFKKEAIAMAWTFVTQELGLDPARLYVSVFKGDETNAFDNEAHDIWFELLAKDFPNPAEREARIWRLTRKDNFWGPPGKSGPCGPCSEIYYDLGDHVKEHDDRYVEIWNLVFMEFEKDEEGRYSALAKKNIDTGAGLERIATILQGVNNSFETDELKKVFGNVVQAIDQDANNKNRLESGDGYVKLVYRKLSEELEGPEPLRRTKVIVDHLRAICFLIADGIKPSNIGRGYVLRMLIRRASRFIYLLRGADASTFLSDLTGFVVDVYGEAYPELEKERKVISEVCKKEEEQFLKTIANGEQKLMSQVMNVEQGGVLSGEIAFDLYSTYGFPLEITEEMAKDCGLTVDLEAYELAKEKHSQVSNTGAFDKSVASHMFIADILKNHGKTNFLGYETLETRAKVVYSDGKKLVLDQTPFYAESGGQLADQGWIASSHPTGAPCSDVKNVKAIEGVFVHELAQEASFAIGEEIIAKVDQERRDFTRYHHSACHLLQAALRKVLGPNVQQMGSQVGPEATRFDFNLERAMTKDEIKAVETLVNNWIGLKLPVITKVMNFDDAVKSGALSFFEEKYEDEVRVLFMGDSANTASVELCGGTHVSNTGEIAKAVIAQEGSVASGIRRIKMLTNKVADAYEREQAELLAKQAAEEAAREHAKQEAKALLEKETTMVLAKVDEIIATAENNGGIKIVFLNTNEFFGAAVQAESIKTLVETLVAKIEAGGNQALVFTASHSDGKVVFMAAASQNLVKEKDSVYNASNLVREAAQICGGGGGGRPNFAQAGGKDASKIADAMKAVRSKLQETKV